MLICHDVLVLAFLIVGSLIQLGRSNVVDAIAIVGHVPILTSLDVVVSLRSNSVAVVDVKYYGMHIG